LTTPSTIWTTSPLPATLTTIFPDEYNPVDADELASLTPPIADPPVPLHPADQGAFDVNDADADVFPADVNDANAVVEIPDYVNDANSAVGDVFDTDAHADFDFLMQMSMLIPMQMCLPTSIPMCPPMMTITSRPTTLT
jgi:hypothetical protein